MSAQVKYLVSVDARLEKIATRFIERKRAELAVIKKAYEEQNYTELIRIGHQMKGSCGGFGFFDLGILGGEMEQAAHDQDLELILKTIKAIEEYFRFMRIEFENK